MREVDTKVVSVISDSGVASLNTCFGRGLGSFFGLVDAVEMLSLDFAIVDFCAADAVKAEISEGLRMGALLLSAVYCEIDEISLEMGGFPAIVVLYLY